MSLIASLKGVGPNGYGYKSTAEDVTAGLDLTDKTFLLTGCNSGLGRETMRVLSLRGAHILGTARTTEKAREAVAATGANGTPFECELAEPASVRRCAAAIRKLDRPLDGIICNAGIMALPKLEQKYGTELQFFTNHIGHFILVTELLDLLKPEGRVVMVSSAAHKAAPREGIQFDNLDGEKGYSSWQAYGQSKLANLLFARELSHRFEGSGRTANALHPGVIQTNLGRHMNPLMRGMMAIGNPLFLKSIPQGAATECYLAAHPDAAKISGEYFADCNPARSSRRGEDRELAGRLWKVSEEIVSGLP